MSNSGSPENPAVGPSEPDPAETRAFAVPVEPDPTTVIPPVGPPARSGNVLAPPVLPPPNPSTRSDSYPVARWIHAAVAVVAWSGLVLRLGLIPIAPDDGAGLIGSLIIYFSNLGIWAVAVAAVVSTLLALNPIRQRRHFDAVRLGSLAMVTITALSYAPVLGVAPAPGTPQWYLDGLLHYVVPVIFIGAYLGLGPRPRLGFGDLARALLFPLVWAGFALLSGAAAGNYPYAFVDVSELGLTTVLVNIGFLLLSVLILAVGYILADKFLPWAPRR